MRRAGRRRSVHRIPPSARRALADALLYVSGVLHILPYLHRYHRVRAFLLIAFRVAEIQFVFSNSELNGLPDRQEHRMFVVPGPDAIGEVISLENVLRAEYFLSFLVR